MRTSSKLNSFSLVGIHHYSNWHRLFVMFLILFFSACKKDDHKPHDNICDEFKKHGRRNETEPTVSVFAVGFNNPRGLKFGPDCHLYVAEAGLGGTNSSAEKCPELQVEPNAGGPFLGSLTGGRISKVNARGERTTVTDDLPSTLSTFGDIIGVADVAFIGNKLHALLFAGCSHGVPEVPTSVVRINADGSHSVVADLGTWIVDHPVAKPGDDFEPEGNPYSFISVENNFYVVEANQGQLLKVKTNGDILRVVDISKSQGHRVPTVVDYYNGNFYVGNLGEFPTEAGTSRIYKISPSGEIEVLTKGFSTILGLVIDKKGRIYVLENTTGNPFPTPGTGRITRINEDKTKDIIATGLSLPTGMTLGPDENLYVSNWGFGAEPGGGQVLKVIIED